jgi:hypothetical protein
MLEQAAEGDRAQPAGFWACFGSSLSDFRLRPSRSGSCFPRGSMPLSNTLSDWQRVRDSNPCTGLERALIGLRKVLINSVL